MITKVNMIAAGALVAAVLAGGCYTQLMTPQEFVQTRRQQQPSAQPYADLSYAMNYNQSCVTCHSETELNERADEMEYYGIRSVHSGFLLSSRDWLTGPGTIIVTSPANPFWPETPVTGSAWWDPAGGTPGGKVSTDRPRTNGPTRDSSPERDRSPVTASPTAPAPSTPSVPSVPVTTTTVTNQPASTPAAPAKTESRGNNDSGSTTRSRNDGGSRDDSTKRPR